MIHNHSLEQLRAILKQTDRSQSQLDYLKNFLSRFAFFEQIFVNYKDQPEFILKLCSVIQYEQANPWSMVIEQFDTQCERAYVILSGYALVAMKDQKFKNKLTQASQFEKQQDNDQNKSIDSPQDRPSVNLDNSSRANTPQNRDQKQDGFGKVVHQLEIQNQLFDLSKKHIEVRARGKQSIDQTNSPAEASTPLRSQLQDKLDQIAMDELEKEKEIAEKIFTGSQFMDLKNTYHRRDDSLSRLKEATAQIHGFTAETKKEQTNFRTMMLAKQFFQETNPFQLKNVNLSNADPDEMKELLIKFYGQLIGQLGPGMLFGEKAITEDIPRTATVISCTEVEFLILQKRDFLNVLTHIHKLFYEKQFFLTKLFSVVFDDMKSSKYLEIFTRMFVQEIVYRKQQIVQENFPSQNQVFVVNSGEFQVTRVFKTQRINNASISSKKKTIVYDIQISHLQKGELIGEEILFGEESYHYTVFCQSQTGMVLTADFFELRSVLPPQAFTLIEEKYLMKKKLRDETYDQKIEKIIDDENIKIQNKLILKEMQRMNNKLENDSSYMRTTTEFPQDSTQYNSNQSFVNLSEKSMFENTTNVFHREQGNLTLSQDVNTTFSHTLLPTADEIKQSSSLYKERMFFVSQILKNQTLERFKKVVKCDKLVQQQCFQKKTDPFPFQFKSNLPDLSSKNSTALKQYFDALEQLHEQNSEETSKLENNLEKSHLIADDEVGEKKVVPRSNGLQEIQNKFKFLTRNSSFIKDQQKEDSQKFSLKTAGSQYIKRDSDIRKFSLRETQVGSHREIRDVPEEQTISQRNFCSTNISSILQNIKNQYQDNVTQEESHKGEPDIQIVQIYGKFQQENNTSLNDSVLLPNLRIQTIPVKQQEFAQQHSVSPHVSKVQKLEKFVWITTSRSLEHIGQRNFDQCEYNQKVNTALKKRGQLLPLWSPTQAKKTRTKNF